MFCDHFALFLVIIARYLLRNTFRLPPQRDSVIRDPGGSVRHSRKQVHNQNTWSLREWVSCGSCIECIRILGDSFHGHPCRHYTNNPHHHHDHLSHNHAHRGHHHPNRYRHLRCLIHCRRNRHVNIFIQEFFSHVYSNSICFCRDNARKPRRRGTVMARLCG